MTEHPKAQCAIRITGPDEFIVNDHKAIDPIGPYRVMLKIEACDICFFDTKLLHQFNTRPRESEIISGIGAETLKEIPSYRPRTEPTTPSHEPVARVAEVGERVTYFIVGGRLFVQADWKHLRATKSNAAFGYNFDGAPEEYVVVDGCCVVSPDGEEFFIRVSEGPSVAVVDLIEPWATIEGSYTRAERSHIADGDHLLVMDEGIIDSLAAERIPVEIVRVEVVEFGSLEGKSFDDVAFFGADPEGVERAALLLGTRGVMYAVLSGERIDRKLSLDIDRVHYDFTRFCDATGSDLAEGYVWIPANGELCENDTYAFIGTAGSIDAMYTVCAITSGVKGLSVAGTDLSDERLEDLKKVIGPSTEKNRVPLEILNASTQPPEYSYTYVICLVPTPPFVSQVVDMCAEGVILSALTDISAGALGDFDPWGIIKCRIFVLDTSGSDVPGVRIVLKKIEEGTVDTAISLWAVTGMTSFGDAIGSVIKRTSGGKIIVFLMLHDLGLTPVTELAEKFPEAAAKLNDGLWMKEAEEVLLASAK